MLRPAILEMAEPQLPEPTMQTRSGLDEEEEEGMVVRLRWCWC